jgi:hypothetical protein
MDCYVADWRKIADGYLCTQDELDAFDELSQHVTDVWDMFDASEADILNIIRTIRQSEADHPKVSSLVLVYAQNERSCHD